MWDVDVGCGMWDVGCGTLDVGCGMWDVRCGIWDVGCGMWDVGWRMEDVSMILYDCLSCSLYSFDDPFLSPNILYMGMGRSKHAIIHSGAHFEAQSSHRT